MKYFTATLCLVCGVAWGNVHVVFETEHASPVVIDFYTDSTRSNYLSLQTTSAEIGQPAVAYIPECVYVVTRTVMIGEEDQTEFGQWVGGLDEGMLLRWGSNSTEWALVSRNWVIGWDDGSETYYVFGLGMGVGWLWFGFGWQLNLAKKIGSTWGGDS